MGRVWRAFDPDLEVVVAIKELKEQFRDQANLERFFREAQIAAKCRHQNIVLITDLSKTPPYFVMEFLEARELSTYTHKGKPITLTQLVKILSQVCDGLGFLHSRGIFHRDLKPANIMLLKDDTVKVTDFGISKAPFGQATMTQVIMGTIPYMSPEQITAPAKVDGRSDLWALGVITYELTQRKHPFPGEGDINTIFHIVHSPPAAFGELPPKVDASLRQILTKALQKNPDDRIRSTEEFKVMLQGLLRGASDPDNIVFPYQPAAATSTSTSIITEEELLKAIAARVFVVVEEIEKFPAARKALLSKGVYEGAAEVARMARVLVAEKNILGLESVVKDLETQKGRLEAGVKEGVARLQAEAEGHSRASRHQESASAWAKILAVEPDHAAAKRGADDAKRALDQAHKDAEIANAVGVLLAKAREAVKQRRPKDVQSAAQKVLTLDPGNDEARALLAEAGSIQGTIELAAMMRAEGRKFLGAGDLEKARRSWSSVLEVEPGDREATEALRTIDEAARKEEGRKAGMAKAGEAEAALRGQDFERALQLYREADRMAPGEASIRKGLDTATRSLEALHGAERDADSREQSGDLKAAVQTWEKIFALQKAHPKASKEIERLRGLLSREEEKARAEAQKKKAEETRLETVAARQVEVGTALEALGTELGAARESIDQKLLAEVREVVAHARKAHSSNDLKALEKAIAEIEAARTDVRDAVQHAADGEYRAAAGQASIIRDVPDEDIDLIGAPLVAKAREALARLDAAHQKKNLSAVREQGKALEPLAKDIAARRDAAVAKGAAAVREATSALEAALKAGEKGLKDATIRQIRDAIARAAKDSTGTRVKILTTHAETLRGLKEGIQREIQEAIRAMRERVQAARGGLEAVVSKNKRAVIRNADLAKRVDAAVRESAGLGAIESPDHLARLAKDLDALRAQIPLDPLRFLPHALAAAAVLVAAGSFLVWKHIQSSTEHEFSLRVMPWGRIVSIQAEGGASIPPPAGESPFHDLKLVPGRYTVAVENQASGATGTLSIEIPAQHEGEVKLTVPDYKQGVHQLVGRDPFFAPNP